MFLLLTIGVLLFTALVMLLVRLARPAFAYHWLFAAFGVLAAWPLALLARRGLPRDIPLLPWERLSWFDTPLTLRVDGVSWPYVFAVTTLVLGVILTVVARRQPVNWRAWAGSLTLAGFTLLAVAAGNPLTLLVTWGALDIVELLILLAQIRENSAYTRAVVSFGARLGGTLLLLAAVVLTRAAGATELSFSAIPANAGLVLLLAAGLRLGVLPLAVSFSQDPPMRRGIGTMLRLAPAAATLVLLARVAEVGAPPNWLPGLLALAGFSALVGAAGWALAADELGGRPYWVLGCTSLAVVAALRGQPAASQAWGIACVLAGGLIFLYSARHRFLLALMALGLVGISGLPFTPLAAATDVYLPLQPVSGLFLLAHALLLLGYARHVLRPAEALASMERWVWVIYPFGLAMLPGAHLLSGFLPAPLGITPAWWAGLAALGLAALLGALGRWGPRFPQRIFLTLGKVFSLDWFYRLLWIAYRVGGRLIALLSRVLEGEGGILWTLALLALTASLAAAVLNGLGEVP